MDNILLILTIYTFLVISSAICFMGRKKIISPDILMILFWSFNILVTIVLVESEYLFYYGILWIITAVYGYAFGAFIGKSFIREYCRKPNILKTWDINYKFAKNILFMSISIAIFITLLKISKRGVNIQTFLNIDELYRVNAASAFTRYYGNLNISIYEKIINQIGTIFIYFSALLGGFFRVYAINKASRTLCITAFIPSIIVLVTENTKLGFIVSVLFYTIGYVCANLAKYKKMPKVNFKTIILFACVGVIFIILMFAAMILRIGRFDAEALAIVTNKLLYSYFIAHMVAFDHWFIETNIKNMTFGLKTFYGITNLLGILKREQGVFSESTQVGIWSTNVYTYFRVFIEDFGKIGALIFMFIAGIFGGVPYEIIIKNKEGRSTYSYLSIAYIFIIYYIVPTFTYSSYIMTMILFWFSLKLILKRHVDIEQ